MPLTLLGRGILTVPAGSVIGPPPDNAYVAEDGTTYYVAEDELTYYVYDWVPLRLPNIVAWFSADSQVYSDLGITPATNGSLVEQWGDKTGNGYNLIQTTSGNRPTFGTAAFNSLNGITFTAASSTGFISSSISLGGTTLSAFVVVRVTPSTTAFGRIVSFEAPSLNDYNNIPSAAIILNTGSSTQIGGYRNSVQLGGYTITNNTNYRFGGIFDGSNYTSYINNVAQASPPTSTGSFSATGRFTVGNDFGSGGILDGVIAEIVVTSSALGSTDRTLLDDYFKVHWNL